LIVAIYFIVPIVDCGFGFVFVAFTHAWQRKDRELSLKIVQLRQALRTMKSPRILVSEFRKFHSARLDVCIVLVHSWTHISGTMIDWCLILSMSCGT